MFLFKFADIGEGLHEGVVAEIYKQVGETVKLGDPLFSVETDKITSDIPAPVDGVISKVLMTKGDEIHVGQVIYHIDDGSKSANEVVEDTPSPKADEEPAEEGASVVGEMKVSNDLLSFDFGAAPAIEKSTPEVAEETPVVETVSKVSEAAVTLEKGTTYDGKVDETFDVIVIGSGPGGYLAAEEAGQNGQKTLIVEKKWWGGACLNVGCIPTKALLKSTDIFNYVKRAQEFGIDVDVKSLKINWPAMQKRKEKVVKQLTSGVQTLMKMSKVKSVFGEAKFLASRTIEVEGKIYKGKNIILATGSEARQLDMLPGFKEAIAKGLAITSNEAIVIKKLPKSITIIGGGVIGVEFAQLFSAAGSKVTIIQNIEQLLNVLDGSIIKEITKHLKASKIKVIYNANTTKIDKGSLFYEVDGKEHSIKSEKIIMSVGRIPNSMGLAKTAVKIGEKKEIVVDGYCHTNVEGVYAIGDVTGKNMLAHVAYQHAHIAIKHILGRLGQQYTGKTVPACIYTHPEIAAVGLTEAQAKASGKKYIVARHDYAHVGRAIASNETFGFAKIIVDTEFGEILGAHIIGTNATDLISEIVVAMDLETTIFDVARSIHPHPTFSEVIWEAARHAALQLRKLGVK